MAEFTLEGLLPTMEKIFAEGGCFRLYPRGVSMRPLLREGIDSVLLKRDGAPKVGDIVLCRRKNGSFILHRVHRIEGDSLYLTADSYPYGAPEGPLPLSSVTARVVAVYRGERKLEGPPLLAFGLYAEGRRALCGVKAGLSRFFKGKKR